MYIILNMLSFLNEVSESHLFCFVFALLTYMGNSIFSEITLGKISVPWSFGFV